MIANQYSRSSQTNDDSIDAVNYAGSALLCDGCVMELTDCDLINNKNLNDKSFTVPIKCERLAASSHSARVCVLCARVCSWLCSCLCVRCVCARARVCVCVCACVCVLGRRTGGGGRESGWDGEHMHSFLRTACARRGPYRVMPERLGSIV